MCVNINIKSLFITILRQRRFRTIESRNNLGEAVKTVPLGHVRDLLSRMCKVLSVQSGGENSAETKADVTGREDRDGPVTSPR